MRVKGKTGTKKTTGGTMGIFPGKTKAVRVTEKERGGGAGARKKKKWEKAGGGGRNRVQSTELLKNGGTEPHKLSTKHVEFRSADWSEKGGSIRKNA